MFKKSIIILASVFITSKAADFIQYEKAFRVVPSFVTSVDNWIGISLGLNYDLRVKNSIIEFNLTPKFIFDNSFVTTYNNISPDTSSTQDFESYSTDNSRANLELGILFSHRPAIIVKNTPGGLTFNLWRYGAFFEFGLFKTTVEDNNGTVTEDTELNYKQCYLGVIYKPTIGFQINERINLGTELRFSFSHDLSDYFRPTIQLGGGISLQISNPIKNFNHGK